MTTAEQELVDRVTQAIRDSNGTPEALEWWKAHPRLVPAHVYARAAIDAMREDVGRPYTDAELARDQDDTRDQTLTLALLADRVAALEEHLRGLGNHIAAQRYALTTYIHPDA